MLKFKIVSNLKKMNNINSFDAYQLDTEEILNKKIRYINNYNFSIGNSYKCNIEKEDNDYIYIKDIEQIGIDINVKDEYDKKLKNLIEPED